MLLKSGRIAIRNFEADDLESFYNYRKKSSVAEFQGFNVFDKANAKQFIEGQKDNRFGIGKEWQQFAIAVTGSNDLIGDCAVRIDDSINNCAEIGCTIDPHCQKQGYAKEAMLLLMAFLFEEYKIRRIVETTDVQNLASIRLLESLGFRKEGHFIENLWFKGRWSSEYQFAMLRHEWIHKTKEICKVLV